MKNFVEDVDNGQVEAHTPRVLSKYCLEATGAETIHTFLHCGAVACTAEATVVEENDSSAIRYASFHWRGETCIREESETPDTLPRQTDGKSCLATATAYALSRFGSPYSSSAIIDTWLGRSKGKPPTSKGMMNLNLELLRHGFEIEKVHQTGTINLRDYYEEGSKLGYEDYKKATLEYRNWQSIREFFETFTEEHFNKYLVVVRKMAKLFEPYEASGQLTNAWVDVNAEYINKKLEQWSIVATTSRFNGTTDIAHAVVVDHVSEVTGGWVVARYFEPDFKKPSRMTEHRGKTVHSIFLLDDGLTLLRHYDKVQPS